MTRLEDRVRTVCLVLLTSIAVGVAPALIWYFADPPATVATAIIAVFVGIKHHANIRRLLKGEEPKIDLSKP